ncbi:hypothetical protein ACIQXG_05035 [Lysinibacillus sphaericus]
MTKEKKRYEFEEEEIAIEFSPEEPEERIEEKEQKQEQQPKKEQK